MCSTSLDTREVSYDEAKMNNNNNEMKQQLDRRHPPERLRKCENITTAININELFRHTETQ